MSDLKLEEIDSCIEAIEKEGTSSFRIVGTQELKDLLLQIRKSLEQPKPWPTREEFIKWYEDQPGIMNPKPEKIYDYLTAFAAPRGFVVLPSEEESRREFWNRHKDLRTWNNCDKWLRSQSRVICSEQWEKIKAYLLSLQGMALGAPDLTIPQNILPNINLVLSIMEQVEKGNKS